MNEIEKLQTNTMIELHKEQFKKTLEIYYSTQVNINKLINKLSLLVYIFLATTTVSSIIIILNYKIFS